MPKMSSSAAPSLSCKTKSNPITFCWVYILDYVIWLCSDSVSALGTRSRNFLGGSGVLYCEISLGVETEGELCLRAINTAASNPQPNQASICSIL